MTRPLFCSGPRNGASVENVPPPTTVLPKGPSWPGVSVGKQLFSFLFLNEPIAGMVPQGTPTKRLALIFEDLTA